MLKLLAMVETCILLLLLVLQEIKIVFAGADSGKSSFPRVSMLNVVSGVVPR